MGDKKRIVEIVTTQFATYVAKWQKCGKKNCTKCPHGPYWYAYIRIAGGVNEDGSRIKSRIAEIYIGKEFRYLGGDQQRIVAKHRVRPDASAELIQE
jgi:hypothetical protein